MIKRVLSTVLSLSLAAAITHAAGRKPQVPVTGNALATFFASQGQTINVHTDQLDLQTASLPAGATIEIQAAVVSNPPSSALGIYNAGLGAPQLYQVFPGAATAGWFSVMSFRTSPARLVVNLFDANGALQGTNTYLGADPSYFGFYLQQNSGAVFYGQDARNGGARLLAFNGTGTRAGATWFAWETGARPSGDYADAIWLLPYAFTTVPVLQTSWGTLKGRFH